MLWKTKSHKLTGVAAVVLGCALAAGCGKKDENNENNLTPNNTTGNNTTGNNTTGNNTANNTTGNNTANNTTGNNTANNTTGNNTTGPMPHEFGCDDLVPTPSGQLSDNYGTYDITDGCLGTNPFAGFEGLCQTLVWTDAQTSDWSGRIFLLDDGTYTTYVTLDFAFEGFFPEACTSTLADGTCDGIATFIDTTAGITTTTCTDADIAGDCNCTITGTSGFRGVGDAVQGANDGALTLSGLTRAMDGSYVLSEADYEFSVEGMTVTTQRTSTTDSFTAVQGTDGTTCEIYCSAFMALCNAHDDVTGYTDDVDCLTQCAGFTEGTAGDTAGDTAACRTYHVFAASDSSDVGNPDIHCVHAQAAPTAACVD